MNIKLYILLAILIILVLIMLHCFYKRLTLLRMYYGSFNQVKNLGYVIALSGAIRSGKTTLMYGLSHIFTLRIKADLQDKMNEIETILKEIDFTELINSFMMFLDLTNDFDKAFEQVIKKFLYSDDDNNLYFSNNLELSYFNYLDYQDKIDLLKKYLNYFLHINRTDHVYSSSRVYNHITSSYALKFKNEWLQLKNNNDFPLDEFSIILEDEKLLEDSNIGHQKKLNEDTGSDVFYRLFGHLFRESSYYFTTLQNANRWLKLEREIAQSHIYIWRSTVVGNYPKIHFLLNVYEGFINIIYSALKKFYKNDRYFNKNNWFKERFYKILQLRKKLFSKSFVFYETTIYHDIELVGKEIKEDTNQAYNFSFVLPVPYVFGVGDTHEFHLLYDYLQNRSTSKRKDLEEMEIREDEIIDVLKKFNKESSF